VGAHFQAEGEAMPPKVTPAKSKTGIEQLHTIPGSANILNVSDHTIKAWLRDGKLRRTKVGARTMIRESQLQRMIKDED
jgi:excisionase family DNA binding protein